MGQMKKWVVQVTEYYGDSDEFQLELLGAGIKFVIPGVVLPCITGEFGDPYEFLGSQWDLPTP